MPLLGVRQRIFETAVIGREGLNALNLGLEKLSGTKEDQLFKEELMNIKALQNQFVTELSEANERQTIFLNILEKIREDV